MHIFVLYLECSNVCIESYKKHGMCCVERSNGNLIKVLLFGGATNIPFTESFTELTISFNSHTATKIDDNDNKDSVDTPDTAHGLNPSDFDDCDED